jgi:hypothetical protein
MLGMRGRVGHGVLRRRRGAPHARRGEPQTKLNVEMQYLRTCLYGRTASGRQTGKLKNSRVSITYEWALDSRLADAEHEQSKDDH